MGTRQRGRRVRQWGAPLWLTCVLSGSIAAGESLVAQDTFRYYQHLPGPSQIYHGSTASVEFGLYDGACGGVHDVLVDIATAKRVGGIDVAGASNDVVGAAPGAVPEQVGVAEPCPVGEQVTNGQLTGN